MPEAYSKHCHISMIMSHIEHLSIVRTVYSGTLRHIQGTLSNIKSCSGILRASRHIEA